MRLDRCAAGGISERQIKTNLATRLLVMFGYAVLSSYQEGEQPGEIPFRAGRLRIVRLVATLAAPLAMTASAPSPALTVATGPVRS